MRKLVLVDERGTPRLVIAAGKEFPGQIIRGKFYPPEMRSGFGDVSPAGIIFLNEEGTEQGGIVWSGKKTPEGYYQGWALNLDHYMQNEIFSLAFSEENGQRAIGMYFMDRPADPEGYEEFLERYAKAFEGGNPDTAKIREAIQWIQEKYGDRWEVPRMGLWRTPEGDLEFSLRDTTGKERFKI